MRAPRLGALLLGAVIVCCTVAPSRATAQDRPRPRRNVIIVVVDGLRSEAVNPTDAPTMTALRTRGVYFVNSHAVFPTFTTPNAAAIATGHFPGDTGDFGNFLFTGFAIFDGRAASFTGKSPGTLTPFIEDDQVLGDIDAHFPGSQLPGRGGPAGPRAQARLPHRRGGQARSDAHQDVTQGNPVDGAFAVPDTVIVDDRTGTAAGLPLPADIAARLQAAGLPLAAPPRTQPAGNNVTPGHAGGQRRPAAVLRRRDHACDPACVRRGGRGRQGRRRLRPRLLVARS